MQESGVVTCADPDARDDAKWDIIEVGDAPSEWISLYGGGVVVEDFDGDELLDIVRVKKDGVDFFKAVADEDEGGNPSWELVDDMFDGYDMTLGGSGSAADFDGDGDIDLFIGRYGAENRLFRNNNGELVDVASEVGLDRRPLLSLDSSWTDLDLDGNLDLMVGNYGHVPPKDISTIDDSMLYKGDGGKHFTDISHWLPERVQGAYVFLSSWIDVNGDLYPDLLSINDFFYVEPNALLMNMEGEGLEIDLECNFQYNFNGMGLGVGDINGDGTPDFAQSSTGKLSWMLSSSMPANLSGSLWIEYALSIGLEPQSDQGHIWGWGAELSDVDNDGDLDLPMNWGYWDDFPQRSSVADGEGQRDGLWIQSQDGSVTNEAAAWEFDDMYISRGLVMTDINRDGWLDPVKAQINGPTMVYLTRCGVNAWLQVDLVDQTTNNSAAIGAKITIEDNGERWTRWNHIAGTSMFSSGPPEVHFGLGNRDNIDQLEVQWPDGEISVFHNVDTRQHLKILRR